MFGGRRHPPRTSVASPACVPTSLRPALRRNAREGRSRWQGGQWVGDRPLADGGKEADGARLRCACVCAHENAQRADVPPRLPARPCHATPSRYHRAWVLLTGNPPMAFVDTFFDMRGRGPPLPTSPVDQGEICPSLVFRREECCVGDYCRLFPLRPTCVCMWMTSIIQIEYASPGTRANARVHRDQLSAPKLLFPRPSHGTHRSPRRQFPRIR